MKLARPAFAAGYTLCALTLFTCAMPLVAMADTPADCSQVQHGHGGYGMRSPFQRAIEQLNLTPEQSASIQSLYDAERQQDAGRNARLANGFRGPAESRRPESRGGSASCTGARCS